MPGAQTIILHIFLKIELENLNGEELLEHQINALRQTLTQSLTRDGVIDGFSLSTTATPVTSVFFYGTE